MDCILGTRLRKNKEVRDGALSRAGRYHKVADNMTVNGCSGRAPTSSVVVICHFLSYGSALSTVNLRSEEAGKEAVKQYYRDVVTLCQ